jgi:hypothetical protein
MAHSWSAQRATGLAFYLLALVCLIAGCRKPTPPADPMEPAWFEEVCSEVGLDFVTEYRGHWLVVRALEQVAARDAIGAEVRLRAGSRKWVRLIQSSGSYLCSSDPRAHFGLGEVTHLDEIRVLWADGSEEVFPGGEVDRVVVAKKGTGQSRPGEEKR